MDLSRLEALLDRAQARGLDALALMPGPNLFYLTGLSFHLSERPVVALFPVDQPAAIVTPAFEADKVQTMETFAYTDEEGYALAFHEACAALELANARIGVETLRMRLFEARLLQRYAADSELAAADEVFAELRMRKAEPELAAMRRAIAVAETAFMAWVDELRLGMTEKEAAARLVAALLAGGAEALAFEPIVASGPNGALPHAVPGERRLQSGDWLVVDWGAAVDGYVSDLTRTVVLGQPAGELVEIHRLVLAANEAGRAAARPGLPAAGVDAATRAVIENAGYGAYFNHRTGHGLGLEPHEPPYMVAGNELLLLPGMTFTVEPGIYIPGVGGVRIEDDVWVSAHGSETLSTLPRAPFVAPLGR